MQRGREGGSLGASFILADWRVRVFWLSGIIDRPSDRLHVHTIPMSGCMGRRSHYRRPPCTDIVMNTWHASIEILNFRFIVNQGPEWVDQLCKTGQNQCEKTLLLDPELKMCPRERLPPLLNILCPGYAILNIPPRQFGVKLTIIWLDQLHSCLASPWKYMWKSLHGK